MCHSPTCNANCGMSEALKAQDEESFAIGCVAVTSTLLHALVPFSAIHSQSMVTHYYAL